MDKLTNSKNGPKTIFIGGDFNDEGGRPSKIASIIFASIDCLDAEYCNGGYFQSLKSILKSVSKYKVIYWFANVPNDHKKLVEEIKQRNPKCILITSKRNIEKKYSFQDIIFRALAIKSNLFLEIIKDGNRYKARVADPLGNVFLDFTDDLALIGKVLTGRVSKLLGYTRIQCRRAEGSKEVPEVKEFFEVVKNYACSMHSLVHVHPEAVNRFLGNAAFKENGLFISQRNIDKRKISKEYFVPVNSHLPIKYWGKNKPSVDTSIAIRLFSYYSKMKFLLHTHAYIEGAPYTQECIPCGSLEEADEIIHHFPDTGQSYLFINLKGHGSLALVDNIQKLQNIPYKARTLPEVETWI